MNRLLETFIRRVNAEGLVFDVLVDLDSLIDLDRLASVATETDHRSPEYLAVLRPQLAYAGQTFQRASIGCRVFAEDHLDHWFAADGRTLDLARCWLLAHARRPELVWELQESGKSGFVAALRQWLRNLPVTEDELIATLTSWLGRQRHTDAASSEKDEAPAAPQDLSGALEELAAEYSKPDLGWWLWQAAEEEVALLWNKMQTRKLREQGGSYAENPDNPFVRAFRDYRLKEGALYLKLKARQAAAAAADHRSTP